MEHLHNRENNEVKNYHCFMPEFMSDPEFWATIGVGVAALTGAYQSHKANKTSKDTSETVNQLTERNQALSEARIAKETGQEAVEEAEDDLLVEITRALQRHNIGNGSLEDALVRYESTRRSSRQQNAVANRRIQTIDSNNNERS